MYKISLSLVIALGLTSSWAQEVSIKQIGLGTGFSFHAEKNELFSAVTHTGSSAPLQLFFRFNGQKDRHHIQMQYSSFDLTSPSSGFTTLKQIGNLQYAYHRKFASINNKFNFFGGMVLNSAQSSQHISVSGNNEYNELNFSFSPSLFAETSLGKGILSIQSWVSLITWAIRPGYALSYPYQSNWMGIGAFTKIGSRISYTKNLSHRVDLRGDYQFEFFRSVKYEPVTSLNHQVILSLVYKIY
jgi:hypothetical protein